MDEFRLQLLKPSFCLLTLSQIAYEACEKALIAGPHFADRELHRKRRPISAFADHHAADPNDVPFSSSQVALQKAVVALAIGGGHQALDVGPYDVAGNVSEQA